jgi:hypothetical protein
MRLGTFKGRAVKGSEQYGDTSNGYPQIALTIRMQIEGGTQDSTTFLIFSPDAAPYSWERLRACGFKGTDLSQELVGIDSNEVDVNVRSEMYEGKAQIKCDIVAGGLVKLSKPTSREEFARKVAAITGTPAAGGSGGSGGGVRPPF